MEYNLTSIISNITLPDKFIPVSQSCFKWCKDQHYAFQNNMSIKGLGLPFLALGVLFLIYIIMSSHEVIVRKTDITEKNLETICSFLHLFAMALLIGYFIWFRWFK